MDTIIITNNIHDLVGVGEEILIDAEGNLIARFYNGMLVVDCDEEKHDNEITLEAA